MKKILFIINPFSGIGKQKTIEKTVKEKIDNTKFEYFFEYTAHSGHASTIAKESISKYDIVIAVGGDGSINEVASELINSDTIFGIIPAGSGNGFARHLKLPLQTGKALEIINNLNVQTIDSIKINDRCFVNIAGIGFDAEMGSKFAGLAQRGFVGYSKAVVSSLKKIKTETTEIIINNRSIKQNTFMVSAANASQYGFNAQISPNSIIDDGLMEVVIIEKFPLIFAPGMAVKLFSGRIEKSKFVSVYKTDKVIIKNKGKISVHIDGEPISLDGDITIKMEPKSLKVIVP